MIAKTPNNPVSDNAGTNGQDPGENGDIAVGKIAIVDDHDGVRRTFANVLRHAGYEVTDFASGSTFLSQADFQSLDCIILDLEMPGMNGAQVLEAMRSTGELTPVLVVSGFHDASLRSATNTNPVAASLRKPIGRQALLAAVAQVLQPVPVKD